MVRATPLQAGGRSKASVPSLLLVAGALAGAEPEPAAGEDLPDQALVGAAEVSDVRVQDRVPRVDEAGQAGLQLHPVEHQLQRDVVARGAGVQVGVEAVLADQRVGQVPQHRGPHLPDPVRDGHGLDVVVGVVVDRQVGAVLLGPDPGTVGRLAEHVGADAPPAGGLHAVRHREHVGQVVAPALTALLLVVQARGGGRATGQPVRDAVPVLVHDHAVVEVGVAGGGREGPHEHLHPGSQPVGRGGEVGVVGAAAVLGLGLDRVVAERAVAVVVDLEVARRLVEAVAVEHVVGPVVGVVEVRDRRRPVRRRRLGQVQREVEDQAGASVRRAARVGQVVVVEVGVGADVVADRVRVLRARDAVGVVPPERRRAGRGVQRPVPGARTSEPRPGTGRPGGCPRPPSRSCRARHRWRRPSGSATSAGRRAG